MHLLHAPNPDGDGGTLDIVLDDRAVEGDGTEWVDVLPNVRALVFTPPDPAEVERSSRWRVSDVEKYKHAFTLVRRIRIEQCENYVTGQRISTLIDTAEQLVTLRQRVWQLAQEAKSARRERREVDVVTLCNQLLHAVKTPEEHRHQTHIDGVRPEGVTKTAIVPGFNDELRLVGKDEQADA